MDATYAADLGLGRRLEHDSPENHPRAFRVTGHIRGTPSWQGRRRLARYDPQYYYVQWARARLDGGCGTLVGTIEEILGLWLALRALRSFTNRRRLKSKRQLKSIPHHPDPLCL
jgi:hypothetical protein